DSSMIFLSTWYSPKTENDVLFCIRSKAEPDVRRINMKSKEKARLLPSQNTSHGVLPIWGKASRLVSFSPLTRKWVKGCVGLEWSR
ncbi:hypothetical protein U0070_019866, partial [Myodes glareolus]